MKKWFFLLLMAALAMPAFSQHRILFELAGADTASQSAVLRQINNVHKVAPDAQIEVVCHGEAITMLTLAACPFREQMEALSKKKTVDFVACANSMRRKKIEKQDLLPYVRIVPVAILEIVEKQEQRWSYIKAGH